MRIDSNGKVGIGTTSPDITGFGWNVLTVVGGTTAGSAGVLELGAPSTDANDQTMVLLLLWVAQEEMLKLQQIETLLLMMEG